MSETNDSQDVQELDKQYIGEGPSQEFATMLEESPPKNHREVSVGDRVSGTIQNIGDSVAFVDYGGRSEASIDLQEIRDESGELTYKTGDKIEAFVASTDGETRLTRSLKASSREVLQQAYENKIPVEGRVTGFNSGGLVVNVGGFRAFCPMSQIDTGYCEDPASYAGQTLTFLILELRGKRNLVVSRKAFQAVEIERAAKELRSKLEVGAEMDGKVTRIERFGAFVDIGGIEGLVHVSEISHVRVGNPRDVLSTGSIVRVKILELKSLGKKEERISLSMRALEPDPWDGLNSKVNEGDVITGKVVSVQKFGAFVEVVPGVEGLVHISQLSAGQRVNRPGDVVSVGQEVKAQILGIDREQKRVSLSMRALQEEAKQSAANEDMAAFQTKQQVQSESADSTMAEAMRRAGLA